MSDARINRRKAGRDAGSRPAILVLVLFLIAGTGLRFYSLLGESAGGDELFCRRLALLSWSRNFQAAARDVVTPPLHYLAYKAWSALAGTGLLELRLLALLFSVAVMVGTVLLGRYIFRDWKVAGLAGILVAGNDLQILFSHFARHYALFSAIVLALAAAFWRAFQNPRKRPSWIAFSGLATMLVYTHYLGWLYLFGFALLVLTGPFRRLAKRFLLAVSVPAALFLPWLFLVIPHYRDRGWLRAELSWMTNPSFSVFPELLARFSGLPGIYSGPLIALTAGLSVIVAVGLVSGRKSRAGRPKTFWPALLLLAGMTAIPPLALFFLSGPPLELPIWGFRHLLPSQAPWALITALGIVSFARRHRRAVALAAIVLAVSLQWLPAIHSTARRRLFPLAEVTSCLRGMRRETEDIYTFSTPGRRGPINYHLGADGSVRALPANLSELPASFVGIYDPESARDREKRVLLEKLGYIGRQTRHFSHPAYFRKRAGALWEIRIELLSRQDGPPHRTDKAEE